MSNSLFWYVTFCFKITWVIVVEFFFGGVGGGGVLSRRGEPGRQELKLTKVAVTGSKQ